MEAIATLPHGIYGLLLQSGADSGSVRAVLGNPQVGTQDEVARHFGLSPNTVKQSWRSAGMPGDTGRWLLGDIYEWRLAYEDRGAVRRQRSTKSNSELESEKLQEEVRKLRASADRLEREEQTAMGNLVPVDAVTQMISAIIAGHAKQMQQIADNLAPLFPQDKSAEYVQEIRRQIERQLTAFSESLARDVLKGAA